MAAKKDGAVITEQGNYLIDCMFEVFPSPERVNDLVGDIAGVVEHSLFYRLAKLAIVGGSGGIEYIEAC
jgi:ribose 5-phosphate isomerase A